MSTIKTTNISHGSNTGTANLVLDDTGKVSIAEKKLYCPGTIIQVVSETKTDTASTASTSWTDTGLQVQITPTTDTNEIFITCHFGTCVSDTGYGCHFKLDGTTSTAIADAGSGAEGTIGARPHNIYGLEPVSFSFLDSPGSTSEKTYKLQFLSTNSGVTVWLNRTSSQDSNTPACIATMTAMEVAR